MNPRPTTRKTRMLAKSKYTTIDPKCPAPEAFGGAWETGPKRPPVGGSDGGMAEQAGRSVTARRVGSGSELAGPGE